VVAAVAHPMLGALNNAYEERMLVRTSWFNGKFDINFVGYSFEDYWRVFEKHRFRILRQKEGPVRFYDGVEVRSGQRRIFNSIEAPEFYSFELEKE